ncbi:bifunctional methionine sulfoxide reductase B/A protein [Legionella parisiensis]|uniref:Peptide methionine sulfoxide reductase MsrA n=1 Tax=Legionella parisiensis TaxID=45071 RepID=A0A1E5JRK7_9GAMM|nr:bifunctional methionine sulfoxide reductase B/A protein [Legionella parisiensis]KTD42722.1 bifunctional methionine sulfoxide reductase B/A protein [Legionella parisiensis]OEH47090.1 Peptide methionine sulfoxide reductase MsrA [Legionella parisiensis]STX71599.1 bifunctional methionine sulfoxide reductase B/A protein [Legionella parisiensis]
MDDYLDKTASLTPLAKRIICDKATEYPHTGAYNSVITQGTYLCRRCGLALFRGSSQFSSGCGWPSFDDNIVHAVKQLPDRDGQRTEILCSRCDAHLGHVFTGECFTQKNLRHCVNSASIDFVAESQVLDTEEAIIAGGCFWGVDHFLKQISGVLRVEVGYTGGVTSEPSYDQVCQGNTGHYEAVRVIYDKAKTDYHQVLKRFFEIHDPTQKSGQGPDLGEQYKSAVFYYNQEQLDEAETLIQMLQKRGYQVATRLLPAQTFWPAEEYHQDYYAKHHKPPYCHQPVNRFG